MEDYEKIKEVVSRNILGILGFIIGIGSIIYSYIYANTNKCEECKCDTNSIAILESNSKEKEEITDKFKNEIRVDVKGAVKKPGVYAFSEGTTVIDAILSAGGLSSNGVTSNINLSKKLKDEMVVYVYNKTELNKKKTTNTFNTPTCECESVMVNKDICVNENEEIKDDNNKLISINSDDINELMKIDGIGESKAKAIIEYRKVHGNFKMIEEIKNVGGIGEKAFDKIKNKITI